MLASEGNTLFIFEYYFTPSHIRAAVRKNIKLHLKYWTLGGLGPFLTDNDMTTVNWLP